MILVRPPVPSVNIAVVYMVQRGGGGSRVEKRASIEWFGLTEKRRRRREDVNGMGGSTSDKK